MARLWILLMIVGYHAIATAKSEKSSPPSDAASNTKEISSETNKSNIDKESPQQNAKEKETLHNIGELKYLLQPESEENIKDLLDSEIYENRLSNGINEDFDFERDCTGEDLDYQEFYVFKKCLYAINQQLSAKDVMNSSAYNNMDVFYNMLGKRSADEDNGPKRLPFRAWGGKKSNAYPPRYSARDGRLAYEMLFRNNAGKSFPLVRSVAPNDALFNRMVSIRDDNLAALQKRINRKKTKFHSWGGKRSFNDMAQISGRELSDFNDFLYNDMPNQRHLYTERAPEQFNAQEASPGVQRRLKFNSWGGKRSLDDDEIANMEELNLVEGKRTFSSWGGKRNADSSTSERITVPKAFSAWGGKRYLPSEDVDMSNDEFDVKRTFNSWGGKRNVIDLNTGERISVPNAFSAWGGKRYSPDDVNMSNNEFDVKRTFNSWGGKRNVIDLNTGERISVPKAFSAWGGKRYSPDDVDMSDDEFDVKRTFNSWGGKRNNIVASNGEKNSIPKSFSAWGGKRLSANDDGANDLSELTEDKRSFSAWGGKRNSIDVSKSEKIAVPKAFNAWGGKRLTADNGMDNEVFDEALMGKRSFSSWGGKRSNIDASKNERTVPKSFSAWGGKRFDSDNVVSEDFLEDGPTDKRTFNSWGGKRVSNDHSNSERITVPKSFSAWGGKRFLSKGDMDGYELMDKRTFNSWGGKRQKADTWGDKRILIPRGFSAWGGKRSILNSETGSDFYPSDGTPKERRSFSSWGGKRNTKDSGGRHVLNPRAFSSWGGKRSVSTQDNNASNYIITN